MADLPLYQGEVYIRDCDTAFFNGKAFPPRGKLVLTNFRIVYMKIGMGTFMALGPLLSQAVNGTPEIEIPLSSIVNALPTKQRGNPHCIKFTLQDGREYTFAVNKKWQEDFFSLPRQPQ
ncbi:MAG TPA: PH domain-containing protein [Ignavibacteriales bacterium]|nr:PH domain-containing protein [Ignavibacteriales bacterium]